MFKYLPVIYGFIRYNIKIVFGNKFPYFILAAIVFYIITVAIYVFSDEEITEASGYLMLLIPSLLLIFYPACFGVQNDQDSKIMEVIFGIPNYRYKVWLFRLCIAYVVCFVVIWGLAWLTDWLVVEIIPLEMSAHIMMPALFMGSAAFMLSTIIRNGNGTAVVTIIIGIALVIVNFSMGVSMWNVFMNPYDIPLDKNPLLFYDTLFYSRLISGACSAVFLLIGLNNLKKREKFI